MTRRRLTGWIASACAFFVLLVSGPGMAKPPDSTALRDAVTLAAVRNHQAELQAIADANGGNRALGSDGFYDSARYVAGVLLDAGYQVELEFFRAPGGAVVGNVVAETAAGRKRGVVIAGAHLDSVASGPGIQDNGSGVAVLLEVAVQFAALGVEPKNRIRFAWWGAEEADRAGSQYHLEALGPKDARRIRGYLGLHMMGSPNGVRFVYDGDGSDTGQPGTRKGGKVEEIFLDYFEAGGLPVLPGPFDAHTSATTFFEAGLPVSGLFGGSDDIKSPDEQAVFGGSAGNQYDPCHHLACDTFDNVSLQLLDEFADAAAHAILLMGR